MLLLALMVCAVLGALAVPRPAAYPADDLAVGLYAGPAGMEPEETEPPAVAPETEAPLPGTLLESGTGLNENFYGRMDTETCRAVHVTESSFDLEPAALGTDQQTLTVHYGPDTAVRIGKAWYREDRYEVYAGTLEDFYSLVEEGYNADVVFEDPAAPELWAKEIWVHTMDIG